MSQQPMSIALKLKHLHWGVVALVTVIACIGFLMMYSAAGGSLSPSINRPAAISRIKSSAICW